MLKRIQHDRGNIYLGVALDLFLLQGLVLHRNGVILNWFQDLEGGRVVQPPKSYKPSEGFLADQFIQVILTFQKLTPLIPRKCFSCIGIF